jgi:uncharacterized protein YpbB
MFRGGKTIPEIAHERALSIPTIEGHLADFVKDGKIDVLSVVSLEKYNLISDYLIQHKKSSMSKAIQDLGRETTYSELRFVLNSLIFTGLI